MLDLVRYADIFLKIFEKPTDTIGPFAGIEGLSVDEAYRIQAMVIEGRVAKGEDIAGFKVGCTSRAIRKQFGLTEPICGHLMVPYVHYGSVTLEWDRYYCCAVEPELVVTIGKDLFDEVGSEEDLKSAIDCVSPGLEVHNYKFWFGDPTVQELIASNGIHACLVVGDRKIPPESFDWEMEGVGLFVDGELAASGIGAEIMGGPMKSLRWLVNHLVRRGSGLRAGQLVIPGSAVELVRVSQGEHIEARFTSVGKAEAVFD